MRRIPWLVPLTILGLAAAVALGGCTSPRGQIEHVPAGVALPVTAEAPYTVEVMPGLEAQGEHRDWNRTVKVSDRLLNEEILAHNVVAHELGHALLGGDHFPAPCIMARSHSYGEPPINALTATEVRAAWKSRWRVIPVRCVAGTPERIREAVAWAAQLWNSALGAEVLRPIP